MFFLNFSFLFPLSLSSPTPLCLPAFLLHSLSSFLTSPFLPNLSFSSSLPQPPFCPSRSPSLSLTLSLLPSTLPSSLYPSLPSSISLSLSASSLPFTLTPLLLSQSFHPFVSVPSIPGLLPSSSPYHSLSPQSFLLLLPPSIRLPSMPPALLPYPPFTFLLTCLISLIRRLCLSIKEDTGNIRRGDGWGEGEGEGKCRERYGKREVYALHLICSHLSLPSLPQSLLPYLLLPSYTFAFSNSLCVFLCFFHHIPSTFICKDV